MFLDMSVQLQRPAKKTHNLIEQRQRAIPLKAEWIKESGCTKTGSNSYLFSAALSSFIRRNMLSFIRRKIIAILKSTLETNKCAFFFIIYFLFLLIDLFLFFVFFVCL